MADQPQQALRTLEERGESAEAYGLLLDAVANNPKRLREVEEDLRRLVRAAPKPHEALARDR